MCGISNLLISQSPNLTVSNPPSLPRSPFVDILGVAPEVVGRRVLALFSKVAPHDGDAGGVAPGWLAHGPVAAEDQPLLAETFPQAVQQLSLIHI